MAKTTIITAEDSAWDDIISQCNTYDFYHTRSYHHLETKDSLYETVLLVCEDDNHFIALPMVIRPILGTPYFDCTSVYGYVGPISDLPLAQISDHLKASFKAALTHYFSRKKIIAAFSRLHPLLGNETLFDDFGSVRHLNKTVAIDTRLAAEEQWRSFRKSNKSEINQLRKKKGYTVKELSSEADLDQFVAIYNETMQRVNAGDYYFFDVDYFNVILRSKDFVAKLLLAMKEGNIAAGAVFTISGSLMQYHLAGTAAAYIYDTPMKLLLDEARLMANSLGLDFLHLGGGVGGSDEDSLFRFKSGFSKLHFQFSTWQYIADEEVYKELVIKNGVFESSYFPLYRAPKNSVE